jgi:hypothetical protein
MFQFKISYPLASYLNTFELNTTIILPIGFHRRETWSIALSEFRMLMGIFEPKRERVIKDWRKLHDEKIHNLYSSRNIIRKTRRVGHTTSMRV